jgi:hypothetical protein
MSPQYLSVVGGLVNYNIDGSATRKCLHRDPAFDGIED